MNQEKLDQIIQHLKKTQKQLRPYFSHQNTDCYRLYSGFIDEVPIQIDRYGNSLHISISHPKGEHSEILTKEESDRIAKALYIQPDKVVIKTREKLEKHHQYSPLDNKKNLLQVHENGLIFLVNLEDYIDTGLFPDHRKTRQLVKEACLGKKILNLFAYTGSFSVYAASGGAEVITTVDLSSTYLEWAKENFRVNNFLPGMFEFLQSDVFLFLENARKEQRKWDLIILDPPTFSNSRKMEQVWDVQKNHAAMIQLCASLLTKEGTILFSTNYKKFHLDSASLQNFEMEEISSLTKDKDFSAKGGHRCWRMTPQKTGQFKSSGRSHSRGKTNPSRKTSPSSGSHRKTRS